MTPEERQVITGIFERLQAAEGHPRDPEAERLIADLVAKQPYAPYAMAQSLYVHEQALANLGQRITDLEQQLHEAQAKPQSGGFLSGLFGGQGPGRQPEPGAAPPTAGSPFQQGYPPGQPGYPPSQQGYPPGQQGYPGTQPQPGPWGAQPRGGGFLQSAMTTAAGVAGGMVIANVLSGAFAHGGGGLGAGLGGFGSSGLGTGGALGTGAGALGFGGSDAGRQDTAASTSGGFPTLSRDEGSVQNASLGEGGGLGDAGHEQAQTSRGDDGLDQAGSPSDGQQDFADDGGLDDDGSADDGGSFDDDFNFSGDV